MTKVTRKARAAAAQPGTIAADPRIIIKDKPIPGSFTRSAPSSEFIDPASLFPAEELATLPLRITLTKSDTRAEVWRDTAGKWWRYGAELRIQKNADTGQREYRIIVAKGANEDDLKLALRAVADMRAGGNGALWRRVAAPWADEHTFALAYRHRAYVDPYTNLDRSPRVVVCDDTLCRATWHKAYEHHELDSNTNLLGGDRGRYHVAVTRPLDGDEWIVEVLADDFYGTPGDVAEFVNDLQWMQAECARANALRDSAND